MSKRQSDNKNKGRIKIRGRTDQPSLVVPSAQASPPALLYAFVYKSALCASLSVLLILSFFLQGVYVVFANEAGAGDELVAIPVEAAVSETVELPVEVDVTDPVEVNVTAASDTITDVEVSNEFTETIVTDVETTPAEGEVAEETPVGDSVSPEAVPTPDEDSESTSTEALGDESAPGDGSTEAADESSSDSALGGDESDSSAENDTSAVATTTETSLATTTVPLGPGIEPISVNYSDSGFTFSKSECTELASGSFYCLEPRDNVLEDALFAAPDKDGDLEIFLVRNGTQTQVTDNFVDDAAPFFDQNSETIVWHRLIDDRYQIISYDLASGEEVQLTKGSANNMEPMRQGRYTVWQRWINNNWEIMLSDGTAEVQVSHASAHDIAPYIHGSLVVWNRYGATGEKTIEMYDIESETYVTVDDPEGLSVTNPRMVLVYDQLHPNGDIVTKGYDMIARRFIQLDTLPRELPEEIPASEPTSETRALIQAKPTLKSDEIVTGESAAGGEPPLPPTATSSDPLTLDMTATSSPVSVDMAPAELSDFDLVVTPLETTLGTGTDSVQE